MNEMTYEQRYNAYMKLTKEELAMMLASRDEKDGPIVVPQSVPMPYPQPIVPNYPYPYEPYPNYPYNPIVYCGYTTSTTDPRAFNGNDKNDKATV